MRDIEYRCWSYNSNTMQGWDELKEHGNFYRLLNMPNKYPLMQFTGLLDAKGNKIFEGDILGGGETVPRSVFFDNGSFRLDHGDDLSSAQVMVQFTAGKLTIIGNIYEHPHLLESN